MDKIIKLIEEVRKVADNYQKEGSSDLIRPDYYMLGKADGLRTAADKMMSLLQ